MAPTKKTILAKAQSSAHRKRKHVLGRTHPDQLVDLLLAWTRYEVTDAAVGEVLKISTSNARITMAGLFRQLARSGHIRITKTKRRNPNE